MSAPGIDVLSETDLAWSMYARPALVISIWYVLNITTVLLNKYLFKVMLFQYPFTLTFIHMVISYIGALISMKQFKIVPIAQISREVYQYRIIPLSTVFCGSIILGNYSLNYISVAFMQTVKSSVPAFSVFLSAILLREKFSQRVYASIFFVVAGVALSTFTELEFSTIGFACAILASVANALQAILTGILLSGENRLDSFNLLYNMAPLSALMLLPFVLIFETFNSGSSWLYTWEYRGTLLGISMLFASGLIAFGLNYVTLLVVKYTSPLTSNVAGNFKVVLSIIFSVIVFGTQLTVVNALGCIMALAGVGLYNYFKFIEAQQAQQIQQPKTP